MNEAVIVRGKVHVCIDKVKTLGLVIDETESGIFNCLPVHCFYCVVCFWFGGDLSFCCFEHNGAG